MVSVLAHRELVVGTKFAGDPEDRHGIGSIGGDGDVENDVTQREDRFEVAADVVRPGHTQPVEHQDPGVVLAKPQL